MLKEVKTRRFCDKMCILHLQKWRHVFRKDIFLFLFLYIPWLERKIILLFSLRNLYDFN